MWQIALELRRTQCPPPQPSDVPRVLTLSWGPNSRDSPSPPPPFSDSSRPASPSPALPQRSYNRNEWLNCLWWSERQGSPLNLPKGMNSLSLSLNCLQTSRRKRQRRSQNDRERENTRDHKLLNQVFWQNLFTQTESEFCNLTFAEKL